MATLDDDDAESRTSVLGRKRPPTSHDNSSSQSRSPTEHSGANSGPKRQRLDRTMSNDDPEINGLLTSVNDHRQTTKNIGAEGEGEQSSARAKSLHAAAATQPSTNMQELGNESSTARVQMRQRNNLEKYSKQHLATLKKQAMKDGSKEKTLKRYIMAFEFNRAMDILLSKFDPASVPQIVDNGTGVHIRCESSQGNRGPLSSKGPVYIARWLTILVAQRAYDGLVHSYLDNPEGKRDISLLLVYSSTEHAKQALVSLQEYEAPKKKVVSSIHILENSRQIDGYTFTSGDMQDVKEFGIFRSNIIQGALRARKLTAEDYGALQDPPNPALPLLTHTTDDYGQSNVDTDDGDDNEDKSQAKPGAHQLLSSGVTTVTSDSSEGEVSEDELEDSTLITNVTEHAMINNRPPELPLDPHSLSELDSHSLRDNSQYFDNGIERKRLHQASRDEQELQERYFGHTDGNAFVSCLICGQDKHLESDCPSRTCPYCGERDDHFGPACRAAPSRRGADHTNEENAYLGRTYFPNELDIVKHVQKLNRACYNCGDKDHWGDDCHFCAPGQEPPPFSPFSAEEANRYLVNPTKVTKSRSLPKITSKMRHNLPSKPPQEDLGMSIKGAAVNSDSNPPARNGKGRMQMNIKATNASNDYNTMHLQNQQEQRRRRSRSPVPVPHTSYRTREPDYEHDLHYIPDMDMDADFDHVPTRPLASPRGGFTGGRGGRAGRNASSRGNSGKSPKQGRGDPSRQRGGGGKDRGRGGGSRGGRGSRGSKKGSKRGSKS